MYGIFTYIILPTHLADVFFHGEFRNIYYSLMDATGFVDSYLVSSWESKGNPPKPSPPRNKNLISPY